MQAGFWIGGARNRDTSPEIQDSTYFFPIGLTVFNTTTREIRNITAMPMGPTQYGGLVHVPSNHGGMGVLVYMGGERPTNPENVREEKKYDFTVASWKTVWVYDIDKEQWYEQETTGDVPEPRTQFCAVTAKDAGSEDGSHHIYVLGGANFKSKAMADGVYVCIFHCFRGMLGFGNAD